jgi:CubicO group peptidase (beta-lactamase class C family)
MTRPQSTGGPPENLPYGFLIWLDEGVMLAGGWAGQHLVVVPQASAVVVVTGDPRFDPGPPARDELPEDWRPALHLVRRHLLPVLLGH